MIFLFLISSNLFILIFSSCSTTRQIREIYNIRSGEEAIIQHTDEDKEFQTILLKALEVKQFQTIHFRNIYFLQTFPVADDDEETPISYTVKLKDSDDSSTPTMKRRSIIKLPSKFEFDRQKKIFIF